MPENYGYETPKGVEPFCWLSNAELDKAYDVAESAAEEALEGLKMAQDERFRRYRIVHMMAEHGDWPGGDLKGMRRQANAPETY